MTEQATEKQIKYAKKLGIKAPWEYSKEDLRVKIQAVLDEQDKQENENEKVPVVIPGKPEKKAENGLKREFHLSPEQVNTNALQLALEWKKTLGEKEQESIDIFQAAKKFKNFIENRE